MFVSRVDESEVKFIQRCSKIIRKIANRVYFSKEEDDQLIDLIKSNPPLFNIKLKSYKNITIKENIWQDIGNKMNKKGKLHSLS